MGAVSMKITSNTRRISTKGVTLISERDVWVRPCALVKATSASQDEQSDANPPGAVALRRTAAATRQEVADQNAVRSAVNLAVSCGALFSAAFKNSRAKLSMHTPSSRTLLNNWLYAMTAGIATNKPAAVVISASAMPGPTARRLAAPAEPSPINASMIPQTVPNSPTNGVTDPVVASQLRFASRAVSC